MTYPGKLYGGPNPRPVRRFRGWEAVLWNARMIHHPADYHRWTAHGPGGTHRTCDRCLYHRTEGEMARCQGECYRGSV